MSHRSYLMCLGMMVRVQITRNDVLRRDLHTLTLRSGTDGCVVLYGTLDSPFSGEAVSFDRTDSTIDIDHVVSVPAAPTLTEDAGHGVTDMPITVQLAKVALAVR